MSATAPARPPRTRVRGLRPAAPRWRDALVVLAITAAAVWLRREGLAPSSLWLDDAWVAVVHRTDSLAELRWIGLSAPGFVAGLKLLLTGVGFSESTAQAPAFAAGVIAPGAAYVLVRRLGWGWAAASLAAGLLAASPIAAIYATRVKPYTLEAVLGLVLIAVAAWALAAPAETRRWAGLAVSGALATAVSVFAAPYVAAGFAAGGVAVLLGATAEPRRSLARIGTAAAGYGVFAVAWYLVVLRPVVTTEVEAFWADHLLAPGEGYLAALGGALVGLAEGFAPWSATVTLTVLAGALVLTALVRPVRAVLLATPTLAAVALATLGLAPLGGGRTDTYLYASLALLLAGAVHVVTVTRPRPAGSAGTHRPAAADPASPESRAPSGAWTAVSARGAPPPPPGPRMLAVALAAVGLAGLVVTAEPVDGYPSSDVAPLADELDARRSPDDAVVVYPATMWAYALYTTQPIHLAAETASSWGFAPRFADDAVHVLEPGRDDPSVYEPTIRALDAEEVWLLASHWRDDYDALRGMLGEAGYVPVEVVERTGAELTRYRR